MDFSSKSEFRNWGNSHFPYIDSQIFYTRLSLLDSDVPEIFKQWHEKETDIFCLTARKTSKEVWDETTVLWAQKQHETFLQNLQEENMNLQELSKISIPNYDKDYIDNYSSYDSGI